jgi:hypothetical protein
MKHSIDELYLIRSNYNSYLATAMFLELHQIPMLENRVPDAPYAIKAPFYRTHNGYALVHNANSIDMIYMYGEKTWFDTKEERDAYRLQVQEEQTRQTARNKAKAQLMQYIDEHMTTEEITSLLHRLGG